MKRDEIRVDQEIGSGRAKRGGVSLAWILLVAIVPAVGDARTCPTSPPPPPKKVTLCHVPPGNPGNAHTITVSEHAVRAHLAHGDTLGECPTGCVQNPTSCDDGNACTSDRCGADGQCAHEPVNCDDGNVCTTDSCDPGAGCVSAPNDGASCDDGNACTGGDVCAGTVCRGSAIAGCCATDADCNDGDACTIDSCAAGRCASQPRVCAVADKCTVGFCDATTGACATAPVTCNDGNVCTDDFCDPDQGCVSRPTANPPQPKETSCADGADNDCDGLIDSADPDCAPPDPGPD
jgi:hypothetical protein